MIWENTMNWTDKCPMIFIKGWENWEHEYALNNCEKKKECGLNGLNSWLNVCWNVKNRKLQRYWLCIEKQRVCSMVISVVEIEVRGKFICLQSMREEILKKKWKFFCGDVELMEFSIKKSTATKVGWDERGIVVSVQFEQKDEKWPSITNVISWQ